MEDNKDRQEAIREKGFDMNGAADYGKIKVGIKTLEDAIINLGFYKKFGERFYFDKRAVMRAIIDRDYRAIRIISDYFYRTNGIYQRIVNYYATMYRWDWYITPTIYDEKTLESEKDCLKITNEFFKALDYLDNTHIKKLSGDIALKVIKYGVCYGYIIEGDKGILFQELPPEYCRCRYYINNLPAIEFNMAYFDEKFKDINYRMRVLKMFPKDFQKGYLLYKERKLQPDFQGDIGTWYLLDPGYAVKFSLAGAGDLPLFINVIPYLLDLDAAQDLDRPLQCYSILLEQILLLHLRILILLIYLMHEM